MRLAPDVCSLDDAIALLYRVFARYRLGPHVDGCPHCVGEADVAFIHSGSLRELGTADLSKYAFKAMTTWGTVDDFRHLLPRLLELGARDGGGDWIDPEVLFGKLAIAKWQRWPDDEREAITLFLSALWRDVLGSFPHPWEVEACLCSVAQVVNDVAPFLGLWDVGGSRAAALHFAEFADGVTGGYPNKRPRDWKLRSSWWDERPIPARQVSDWLIAAERTAELEQAFEDYGMADDDTAARLSNAINYLAWLRSAATS